MSVLEVQVQSLGQEDHLEEEMAFLPGIYHGKRSLVGFSPWSCKSWTQRVTKQQQSCVLETNSFNKKNVNGYSLIYSQIYPQICVILNMLYMIYIVYIIYIDILQILLLIPLEKVRINEFRGAHW